MLFLVITLGLLLFWILIAPENQKIIEQPTYQRNDYPNWMSAEDIALYNQGIEAQKTGFFDNPHLKYSRNYFMWINGYLWAQDMEDSLEDDHGLDYFGKPYKKDDTIDLSFNTQEPSKEHF